MTAALLAVSIFTAIPAAAEEPSVHQDGALLDSGDHSRGHMFSVFAGLPYYRGIRGGFPGGFGLRYLLPVVREGILPSVNDELAIEFGGDFDLFPHRDGIYYGVSLPLELLWDFHFHPRFDAYWKLGLALSLGFGNYYYDPSPAPYGLYPISAIGLRFLLGNDVYLRAEAGYPWARLGLAFAF